MRTRIAIVVTTLGDRACHKTETGDWQASRDEYCGKLAIQQQNFSSAFRDLDKLELYVDNQAPESLVTVCMEALAGTWDVGGMLTGLANTNLTMSKGAPEQPVDRALFEVDNAPHNALQQLGARRELEAACARGDRTYVRGWIDQTRKVQSRGGRGAVRESDSMQRVRHPAVTRE